MADATPPQPHIPPNNKKPGPNPFLNTGTAAPGNKEQVGSLVERLRSFESDMARLKGVHLDPVVPEKKPVIEDAPPLNPIGIAGKPEPYIQSTGNTAKSLEATNKVISEFKKEDPQKAVDALHKEEPLERMRTIQTDVAEAEKHHTPTVADIITAQQQHIGPKVVIEDPKKGIYYLMLSGVLILTSVIIVGSLYLYKTRPKAPPPIIVDAHIVVPTERTQNLIVDTTGLINQLAELKKQSPSTKNEIVRLLLKDETSSPTMSGQRAASLVSPTIPAWLVRSFDEEAYLVGLHNATTNGWQPVFIFKINSYENAYAGMLKWEETMPDDLQPILYQRAPRPTTTASTTVVVSPGSTSTVPTTTTIFTQFKDVVIKNKDTRVLQDGAGRKLILYSFTDPNTLVITTDQQTLEEAIARLTTSKFVR
jgi:hypothetical protein